jgi:hypothetical protein
MEAQNFVNPNSKVTNLPTNFIQNPPLPNNKDSPQIQQVPNTSPQRYSSNLSKKNSDRIIPNVIYNQETGNTPHVIAPVTYSSLSSPDQPKSAIPSADSDSDTLSDLARKALLYSTAIIDTKALNGKVTFTELERLVTAKSHPINTTNSSISNKSDSILNSKETKLDEEIPTTSLDAIVDEPIRGKR